MFHVVINQQGCLHRVLGHLLYLSQVNIGTDHLSQVGDSIGINLIVCQTVE